MNFDSDCCNSLLIPPLIITFIYPVVGVKQPVHLMFAIDTASMGQAAVLNKSKVFFRDLGNRFKIPAEGIAHGFLKFDVSGTAKMDFVTFYNYIALPAYVNTLQSTENRTTLDQAMRDSVPGLLNNFENDIRLKYSQYPKVWSFIGRMI